MKYFTLASLSLGVWKVSANTDYTMTADKVSGPINFLSHYLSDTSIFNGVVDHGCWCNNLDSNSELKSIHGGSYGIDDLDEYCRSWLNTRTCSAKFMGGSCYQKDMESMEYSAYINHDTNSITCNTHDPVTGRQYTDCELDSCIIDKYYIETIGEWITNNGLNSTLVEDPQACGIEMRRSNNEKECLGKAPFLKIAYKETKTEDQQELEELCSAAEFDFIIVNDGSGSVGASNYDAGMDFLDKVINSMTIGPDNTRVTVYQFATDTEMYGSPMETDPVKVQANLDTMRNNYMSQLTFTPQALYYAWLTSQTYGRPGVPQIVFLMTDGGSSNGLRLDKTYNWWTGEWIEDPKPDGHENFYSPNLMHDYGITAFSIGVGYGINEWELQEIATDPDADHLFLASSYDDLDNVMVKISKAVCNQSNSPNVKSRSHNAKKYDAEALAKFSGAEGFENLGQINTMPRLVVVPDNAVPE